MPVNVPNNLPAIDVLKEENIFVMENSVAIHQDIRPLRIAILNIMPIKSTTETQLLRILSNSPLQLEIELFYLDEHESTHTPKEHLMVFYKTFKEIKNKRYDGMIVTGAPVERLEFEDVDYWEQMKEVMDWSTTHVTST
ncbi:MAG: homoserine O-succinyltransferase, partial [Bacteroidota bacterium]|nr:homoserine O-succinyltransferase [Bacteroidota bacterium]